jgi:hypothetical protein
MLHKSEQVSRATANVVREEKTFFPPRNFAYRTLTYINLAHLNLSHQTQIKIKLIVYPKLLEVILNYWT